MKMIVRTLAGVCVFSLAACGGGGGGGDDEDLIVSDGLLRLEYPADIAAQLAGTPFLDTFNEIERVNSTGTVEAAPAGSSVYTGTFGFQLDNDGALVTGDTTLTVNSVSDRVETAFTATAVTGGNTNPTGISGTFEGTTVLGDVQAGYYAGGLSGNITVEYGEDPSQTFSVGADLEGVFAEGGETIGDIQGRIDDDVSSGSDTARDTFGGLYYATESP